MTNKSIPHCDSLPGALANFDSLPDSANVRIAVVKGLYGISDATVWRRVASNLLPKPRKISGSTIWNVGDLRRALAASTQGAAA